MQTIKIIAAIAIVKLILPKGNSFANEDSTTVPQYGQRLTVDAIFALQLGQFISHHLNPV